MRMLFNYLRDFDFNVGLFMLITALTDNYVFIFT